MDIKEARALLKDAQADSVRLVMIDLNGTPRGKRVPLAKFFSACEHGAGYCSGHYTSTVDSSVIPELPTVGFSTGFPDIVAWPDLETLALLPWDDGAAWVICDLREADGSEVPFDPRTMLKRQIERLAARNLKAIAGLEYEFYVFRETPTSLRQKKWATADFEPLFYGNGVYDQVRLGQAGPWMTDIWRHLPAAGVPLEAGHMEMGGGHVEYPIGPSEALAAADRAVLFKVGVKEICRAHGLLATFMAKIDQNYEGLSGAVHHSLVDKTGQNLFHDPTRPLNLSETFDNWCEGLLANLSDSTLIFLPTVNSYKRPLPGSFVGNSTTWSVESRATTLRAINFEPQATRIENRLPGSDANPYLVLAAHLAAGLYGLEQGLKLRPPFIGADPAFDDLGREDVAYIPNSMDKAIEAFEASPRMVEFFGHEFCQTFAAHRRSELESLRGLVADWERARYLEYA